MKKLIRQGYKNMTIGLIARADNSGLGTLSWEFAKHINFDEIKLVSNGRYKMYPERFYNVVDDLNTDIVLTFETTYDFVKKKHQKLVLVPMYECTHPAIARKADKIISPSLLDKQYYPDSTFLPIPVNRELLPFKLRTKAKIFIHNAGHGGLGGRNGTKELIKAMEYVKSDIQLIINSQIPIQTNNDKIKVIVKDYEGYQEIWKNEGDIFIFPEKFNGLSLPIQEAISVGMPVMCGDRYPFNAYLPKELLIPVEKYQGERIAVEFDLAVINPKDIAKKIDEWANKDIAKISQEMNDLAEMLSWTNLKDKWKSEIQK